MVTSSQCPMYKDKLCWKQVLALSSANFSQAVMLTTPFTIGVFMVRDFEAAKHGGDAQAVDEQVVGRLTGLLAGIFSFSGFLTAYAWGCASNYIGRKPVIVIGTAVSYVSMLWFGLAGSYGNALAARAFGGFFNGILGAWKCMIGESTAVLLQGKFFGYMSLAWGLGCIAGPALGGAFARPCQGRLRLPLCGPGQLLRARPYFLACLVGSTTLLASLLLCVFLLRETLPQPLRERGLAARLNAWRRREREDETQPLRSGGGDCDDDRDGLTAAAVTAGATGGSTRAVEKLDARSSGEGGGGGGGVCTCRPGAKERAALLGPDAERSDEHGGTVSRSERLSGGRPADRGAGTGVSACGAVALELLGEGGKARERAASPPGSPLRSPSLARMRGLFRLASRTFVGAAHPFARSGSWLRRQGSGRGGGGGGGGSGGGGSGMPGDRAEDCRGGDGGGRAGGEHKGHAGDVEDPWVGGPGCQEADVELSCRESLLVKSTSPESSDQGRASARREADGDGRGGVRQGGAGRVDSGSSTSSCSGSTSTLSGIPSGSGSGSGSGSSCVGPLCAADSCACDAADASSSGRGMCPVPPHTQSADRARLCPEGCLNGGGGADAAAGAAADGENRIPLLRKGAATAENAAAALAAPDGRNGGAPRPSHGVRDDVSVRDDAAGGDVRVRDGADACEPCALAIVIDGDSESGGGNDNGKGRKRRLSDGKGSGGALEGGSAAGAEEEAREAAVAAGGGGGGGGEGGKDVAQLRPLLPWYRYPQIVLTILGYGITALIFCALDEVFPIFAAAPRGAGGLGMREEQIAPPLMFFGAVLMPYSLYGYPPLQRAVGTLRLTRVGLLAAVGACLMVPFVATVRPASDVGAMLVLYSAQVVKAFAQCSAFTGSIIAVNAAPAPEQLGAVNGVGQTLAALVRGLGPATGGLLWAASVGLHAAGQQFLTFAMIALLALGNYVLYRFVRLPGMK